MNSRALTSARNRAAISITRHAHQTKVVTNPVHVINQRAVTQVEQSAGLKQGPGAPKVIRRRIGGTSSATDVRPHSVGCTLHQVFGVILCRNRGASAQRAVLALPADAQWMSRACQYAQAGRESITCTHQ